jgi:hypothetical protein
VPAYHAVILGTRDEYDFLGLRKRRRRKRQAKERNQHRQDQKPANLPHESQSLL